jgi:8-oxo-dGTP pyrophosphatase MutT (NUDIX family)
MFVAEFLNTVPVGKLLWEFPKGKPARKSELPYDTALREFREETGVTGEITSLQIEQGSYTDHNEVARITYTTHMYIGYMDLVCGKWPQTKSSLEAQCAVWIPYDKLPLFIAANTLAAINYKL